jgi:hypothetical protein
MKTLGMYVNSSTENSYGMEYLKVRFVLTQVGELEYSGDSRITCPSELNEFPLGSFILEHYCFLSESGSEKKILSGTGTEFNGRIKSATDAKSVSAIFTRIENGLEKSRETDGYVRDFPDLVRRIALILKVKDFYVYKTEARNFNTGASREENLGAFINTIEYIIRNASEKLLPTR